MSMRLMQVYLAVVDEELIKDCIDGQDLLGAWVDQRDERRVVFHLLVRAEHSEALMDKLQGAVDESSIRILLYPIDAVLPRPQVEDETPADDSEGADDAERVIASGRVSREELYADVDESLGLTRVFVATTGLSAVVAAIGLLRDDVAVIIGAMVIAPLLGPLVALSLGTILGDLGLLRRASLITVIGVALAFALAALIGAIVDVDPSIPAIARRSELGLSDMALALAAGAAGAFAFTRGVSAALIGVMVAVALMPPLVAAGLQIGGGHLQSGSAALALCAANILCVNLAGVGTFLAQGVRPRNWWEADRAQSAVRWSIAICGMLLVALAALVYLLRPS